MHGSTIEAAAGPDTPFYQPEAPYKRTGQYAASTTFVEEFVFFQGK